MINDECGDDLWKDQPNKKCHKDIDARWTKKNGDTFYGYKNHVKVDSKSKIIGTYYVTDASVHDSQVLDTLLTKKDEGQELFADSAYTGSEQKNTVSQHGMINKIHEKGYKNKPLTEEQIAKNNLKSKTRVRVVRQLADRIYGAEHERHVYLVGRDAKGNRDNWPYELDLQYI